MIKWLIEFGVQTVPIEDAEGNPLEGKPVVLVGFHVWADSMDEAIALVRPLVENGPAREFVSPEYVTEAKELGRI